jgi:hypothetical protein
MFRGKGQSPQDGRPWSANWRALAISRIWLRQFLTRYLDGRIPSDLTETHDQLTAITANSLGTIINDTMRQAMFGLSPGFLFNVFQDKRGIKDSNGFTGLNAESSLLVQLRDAARPGQPDDAARPGYANLASQYLDTYGQLLTEAFDHDIAR